VPYVGQRITGLRNKQLVAGKGTFVGDIDLPDMAHMAVLRSPFAHARIRSVDTSAAEQLPGVLAVVTGAEIAQATDPIPEAWDPAEVGAKSIRWYALAPERVRFVGEAVAAVVAEDKYTAYEALELIEVDYEELPAVTDPEEALKADTTLVEPTWPDNVIVSRDFVTGDPDKAFAEADGSVSGVVQSNRITGSPIEPRGVVAKYDPYEDQYTVWDSTQDPHPLRVYLAETLRVPERSVRVIQPHVGGAFGLKQPTFQEEPLAPYMARKVGRPVKWIEERSENFQVGGHSRDTRFYYEAAYTEDGRITGIRIRVIADVGAPTALLGWGMSFVTWYCLPTVYDIPNVRMELFSVVTNKCPWNAYRGYGKDAASFLMDRVVDHVSKTLRKDRVEVRFLNFIPPERFPHPQPSGAILDSGDYPAALQKLLELIDYDGFPRLQQEARQNGRYIGLGIGQELTPEGASVPGSLMIGGYDGSNVRVLPTGEVLLLTGVTSPGSGNETGLAQIVADTVGCRIERVRVIQGDTDACPWGLGNYSSRSIILGGSAAHLAAVEIREKILRIAGSMLEASPEDLDASEGRIYAKDAPQRFVTLEDVATQAYRHTHGEHMDDEDPALESTRHFKIGNVYHQPEKQGRFSTYPTWPYGVAACVVEVDPETGYVTLLRYCLVHDAGTIINPLLADANLHGGMTQGIGSALYEEIAYDEFGQPLTATFMDYTIPTAIEAPKYELGHLTSPSPFTPLGAKGVGESGVGAALGALCGAIEDALPHLELHLTRLPLTPNRVWKAIQEAESKLVHR
jgi:aerobic carbon-monoxide dehydrogenase large subunit